MNKKEYDMLLTLTEFPTLEMALLAMMEGKRREPIYTILLYPLDEQLSEEWGLIGSTNIITNIPNIWLDAAELDSSWDPKDDDPIEVIVDKLADDKAYVAKVAAVIRLTYGVEGDKGWYLYYDAPEDYIDVKLFIAPEFWQKVKNLVEEYNAEASANGFTTLTLDDKDMVVGGQLILKPELGGFFERRRIKRQNKVQYDKFMHLCRELSDYTRRI